MTDLSTTYLGLSLAHPLVASASPISRSLDGVRSLEDHGAAAIVLASLFEEQIRMDNDSFERFLDAGSHSAPEASSYFPAVANPTLGPDEYLRLISDARAATNVPIIASLNGESERGWTEYASLMERAGAHAIELNIFHLPVHETDTGRAVETRYETIVAAVRSALTIPLAVKVGPYFSAFGEIASRFEAAGANGLVLFNRFYQPDFDLETMEIVPDLQLSTPVEIRLPLLWIATLHGRTALSLAATTGVDSSVEVAKYLLAGADVVMTTSALLRHGASHLENLRTDLERWMDARGYDSVSRIRGAMSRRNAGRPDAFERANYLKILQSWR